MQEAAAATATAKTRCLPPLGRGSRHGGPRTCGASPGSTRRQSRESRGAPAPAAPSARKRRRTCRVCAPVSGGCFAFMCEGRCVCVCVCACVRVCAWRYEDGYASGNARPTHPPPHHITPHLQLGTPKRHQLGHRPAGRGRLALAQDRLPLIQDGEGHEPVQFLHPPPHQPPARHRLNADGGCRVHHVLSQGLLLPQVAVIVLEALVLQGHVLGHEGGAVADGVLVASSRVRSGGMSMVPQVQAQRHPCITAAPPTRRSVRDAHRSRSSWS